MAKTQAREIKKEFDRTVEQFEQTMERIMEKGYSDKEDEIVLKGFESLFRNYNICVD